VQGLIGLLGRGASDEPSKSLTNAQAKAAGALENLSGLEQNRRLIGQVPDVFKTLIELLGSASCPVETQSHIAGEMSCSDWNLLRVVL
jgi:hypothetical protein